MILKKILIASASLMAMSQVSPAMAACIYYGAAPSVPPVTYVGSVSASQNVYLYPGSSIVSPSGVYTLIFQGDGNLVLYKSGQTKAVWASGSTLCSPTPYSPLYTRFQPDGNLVVYSSIANTPTAQWDTNTQNHPDAVLKVQDDGNVVIYTGTVARWARTW